LGWFAGWLLSTRALALALIVGVLGFGLLGPAVSTFVWERKGGELKRGAGSPIVEHLPGALLRGLSPAIIVFLAALGGLSIFGMEPSEPNPYVLFLASLIGAVFSQEVWGWAYTTFRSKLKEKVADQIAPPGSADPQPRQANQPPEPPGTTLPPAPTQPDAAPAPAPRIAADNPPSEAPADDGPDTYPFQGAYF
jgi:hypothetical protein